MTKADSVESQTHRNFVRSQIQQQTKEQEHQMTETRTSPALESIQIRKQMSRNNQTRTSGELVVNNKPKNDDRNTHFVMGTQSVKPITIGNTYFALRTLSVVSEEYMFILNNKTSE